MVTPARNKYIVVTSPEAVLPVTPFREVNSFPITQEFAHCLRLTKTVYRIRSCPYPKPVEFSP